MTTREMVGVGAMLLLSAVASLRDEVIAAGPARVRPVLHALANAEAITTALGAFSCIDLRAGDVDEKRWRALTERVDDALRRFGERRRQLHADVTTCLSHATRRDRA